MKMTRGGAIDLTTNRYVPDLTRSDIRQFVEWCMESGAPEQLSTDFVLAFLGYGSYREEPPAPKPDDDLLSRWDIDDDREDIMNALLSKRGAPRVRWNDPTVLNLRTVGEMFLFLHGKLCEREHDAG